MPTISARGIRPLRTIRQPSNRHSHSLGLTAPQHPAVSSLEACPTPAHHPSRIICAPARSGQASNKPKPFGTWLLLRSGRSLTKIFDQSWNAELGRLKARSGFASVAPIDKGCRETSVPTGFLPKFKWRERGPCFSHGSGGLSLGAQKYASKFGFKADCLLCAQANRWLLSNRQSL